MQSFSFLVNVFLMQYEHLSSDFPSKGYVSKVQNRFGTCFLKVFQFILLFSHNIFSVICFRSGIDPCLCAELTYDDSMFQQ